MAGFDGGKPECDRGKGYFFDGGDPCFIATAAYGTPLHNDINILRNFRDIYLIPNSIGNRFVSLYYRTSPRYARKLAKHETSRKIVRNFFIKPLVYFAQHLI